MDQPALVRNPLPRADMAKPTCAQQSPLRSAGEVITARVLKQPRTIKTGSIFPKDSGRICSILLSLVDSNFQNVQRIVPQISSGCFE